MRYVQITVQGNVQGVFFRKHTQQVAQDLGIKGYVCNKSDGSVYIEACGPQQQILQLIAWCHNGPRRANVKAVKVVDTLPQTFDTFYIMNTD